MVGDLDCVPSFVHNKGRASESGVFDGELHGTIGNMDGSNKMAENDPPGCEEESNPIARINPIVGAPRVGQGSSTPSAENGNVGKQQAIICDFFAKGWCIKGNSCTFLHVRDSVGVTNQHRWEDVAQKGMYLVDNEASSVPESHQPEDVENTKGKGELEFLLHNVSSMDLGSDSGREFLKIDPSPVFKDHSIHGMYSGSPGFPDARIST